MNNLLNAMGHDPEVYEDFVEDTLVLLERTRVDLDMHEDNERNLLASFNDAGIVAAVITHFRVRMVTSMFDRAVAWARLMMGAAHCRRMDADKSRLISAIHYRLHHRSILCRQD